MGFEAARYPLFLSLKPKLLKARKWQYGERSKQRRSKQRKKQAKKIPKKQEKEREETLLIGVAKPCA